ncbi:PAS domain-containing protein [Desulfosoma sp.]
MESLGAGLITADAQGKITYANQAARVLLGVCAENLEGRPVAHWLPALQGKATVFQLEKALPAVSMEDVASEAPQAAPPTFRKRSGRFWTPSP